VRHQDVVMQLALLLGPYVAQAGGARLLAAPTDVRRGNRTSVQPDLLVVRLDDGGRVTEPVQVGDLLLAIEVLSPTTARTDRQEKRRLCQTESVGEYWIVDADAQLIERWRPGDDRPEIVSDRIDWQCFGAAESLSIDLPEFFASILPG
jgi:Uma2 family endonuclease